MGLKRVYAPDLILSKKYHEFKLTLASEYTPRFSSEGDLVFVLFWLFCMKGVYAPELATYNRKYYLTYNRKYYMYYLI